MTLQQFLNYYGITTNSLEEIKKRVFIVGRFNTAEAEPAAYLFSKNGRKDSRYKASRDLSYSNFIDVINPTLTENYDKIEIAPGEAIPYFELAPKKMDSTKGDTSYVIDPYNYFFQRAISTSEHEHYKTGANGSTQKLLKDTAGETIYREIKANLNRYCAFQSRNYEMIRAFSKLLNHNRGKGGIPTGFSDGEVLPLNFLPIFIDFLYQEGTDAFSTKDVDFKVQDVWLMVGTGAKKEMFEANFSKLITAFKNYLIDPKGLNKERIEGIDLSLLPTYVSEELRSSFVASRDSYNMLRQIIRSKVLLSMVLQWAINSFHKLDSVKDTPEGIVRNRAVEKAIKEGTDGLAKPQSNLPNNVTIPELIKDFKSNFPVILEYVNEPDNKDKKEAFEKMSGFLQNIGNKILKDEAQTANIRLVLSMHPDQKRATMVALENFFVDVLIPRMFKEPGLTLDELKRKFSNYEAILFQQSSMMEVADVEKVGTLNANDKESYEVTFGRVMTTMLEILLQGETLKGIIRTAQTIENQAVQRALLPAPSSMGTMVPLLAPVDNVNTDAYSDSIKLPVSDAIITKIGFGRKETLEKIRGLLPKFTVIDNNRHLLAEGEAERATKLLEGGADAEKEETNKELIEIDERGAFLQLKEQALSRMDLGKINLSTALQSYVSADNDEQRSLALTEVKEVITNDVKTYHYNLSKIYKKYTEPTALPNFKNMVEGITLCQLLLAHQDELHLDKAGTNLYDLLLDLVEFIKDPENPDLKEFFSNHSLTKYIDMKHFNHNGKGFAAIETILKNQGDESLKNVKQYVSELQGVKYLFDVLNKSQVDCEVVVINAHGKEFLKWVVDNINIEDRNLLNPAGLVRNATNPQFPIMTFMSELAFNQGGYDTSAGKEDFLKDLSSDFSAIGKPSQSRNIAMLGPICISTSVADSQEDWVIMGKKLSGLCKDVYSPVVILGPSLPMNSKSDKDFDTILSAGYAFCTHLLTNGNQQKIEMRHVNAMSNERFRVIGYGAAGVVATMKHVIEAPDPSLDYSFGSDYYLYMIALIAAAVKYSWDMPEPAKLGLAKDFWEEYYEFFNYYAVQTKHRQLALIDKISLFKNMSDWSLSNDVSGGQELEKVNIFINDKKDRFQSFKTVEWFNNLIRVLDLKKAEN